jgi:3-phenylpropionate/trans-cinnamate dioxygenase ferredoxin reductase subunit
VSVIIIGGGHAGFQAAASLRTEGYEERIFVIGDEPHIPYQRPPLSKGFLLGKQEARHATLRPAAFYDTQRIELLNGRRVVAIDTVSRRIALESGQRIEYDALIFATGTRNRLLAIPGATLDGVFYLRTLDEAGEIRQRLNAANSVAIIGGGFIGLEIAAAARMLGKPVTVIEALPRLMARVVAPVVSEYFRAQHAAQGAEILLNATVAEIRRREVVLKDGTLHPADLIAVGIGVVPNLELARDAGLTVGNGIAVDEFLRTGDENVYAIGDCAEYPNPFAQTRVRLESVQNAVDQAASAAKAIVGRAGRYESAPWFWTDQYDIKLQMTGLSNGFDQVVTRGDLESRKFSVFYFRDGRLCAVDSINRPVDHLAARKLIAARASLSADQARDESVDLKTLSLAEPS